MIDIDPRQLPIAWKYNRYSRDKKLLSIFLFATPQVPTGLVHIEGIGDEVPGTKSLERSILISTSSLIALIVPYSFHGAWSIDDRNIRVQLNLRFYEKNTIGARKIVRDESSPKILPDNLKAATRMSLMAVWPLFWVLSLLFPASLFLQKGCQRQVIFVIKLDEFIDTKVVQSVSFRISPSFFAADNTVCGIKLLAMVVLL